jgi:hypothetical protein
MANFDLVSSYDEEFASWLEEQGYPHPAVRSGNEMPTTADMKWALKSEHELSFKYPRDAEGELYGEDEDGQTFSISGFDWEEERTIPGDYFTIRGSDVLLPVLVRLCGRCGQLLLYPDSGDPAIILDASLDAEAVAEVYAEANEQEDPWAYFFEQMYGPGGTATG